MSLFFISFFICLAFILGKTVGVSFKKGKQNMITQFLFQSMKARSNAVLTKMGVYQPQITIGRSESPIGSGLLCFNDSLEHLERIGKLAAARNFVKSEQTQEQT